MTSRQEARPTTKPNFIVTFHEKSDRQGRRRRRQIPESSCSACTATSMRPGSSSWRASSIYRQGLIAYLHPVHRRSRGAAGACAALRPDDYIGSTHRPHCISKGADLRLMDGRDMGKATGYCRGAAVRCTSPARRLNHLGANGIVGGGIPIATGLGHGGQGHRPRPSGGGFLSDGWLGLCLFESLNLAALPAAVVLPAGAQPLRRLDAHRVRPPAAATWPAGARPKAFLEFAWNGNDAAARVPETLKAVERARRGEGPTLIEAQTYPHGGHHVNDPGSTWTRTPWPNGRRATR